MARCFRCYQLKALAYAITAGLHAGDLVCERCGELARAEGETLHPV